jgi:hypothetical protein
MTLLDSVSAETGGGPIRIPCWLYWIEESFGSTSQFKNSGRTCGD